jgi:CDP-diacylglycerol--glycerol-3-phosphate 3-phosphatidyltransferase
MTKPRKSSLYSWPNILTFGRIAAVPLLVICVYLPYRWGHFAATIIFIVASFTDWLDGYLARFLQQTSRLGAFLDPVADKLMVSIALMLIVAEQTFKYVSVPDRIIVIPTAVVTIPAMVIVAREIIVSALREWMAELGKRASVRVSSIGKIKTGMQMFSITILLFCGSTTNASLIFTGFAMLYAAALLTIWSMVLYLQAARQAMLGINRNN